MTLIAMLSSAHTARTLCGIFLMAVVSSGCSKHEESKETLLSRASGYLASAQYDKAEKEYREVLRLTPDDPVALRQLAIIYFDQDQLPQPIRQSRKPRKRSRTTRISNSSLGRSSWRRVRFSKRERQPCARSRSSREEKRHSCCWPLLPPA